MSDKYYTPDISEFHVGFECEINHKVRDGSGNREWDLELYRGSSEQTRFITFLIEEQPENIRVKYLDKEDIESLGFRFLERGNINNFTFEKLGDTLTRLSVAYGNSPIVSVYKYGSEDILPRAFIKNKPELKKLLQQLNILDETT